MDGIVEKIRQIGIVPVVALDDDKQAVPLAKALVEGGLSAIEVTFRTDAAEQAIRRIVEQVPDMLVGAGTVLTTQQADRAIAAGAQFIVSPGFNPSVVRHVLARGICMMPGTATPGEMEQAMELGLKVVKFFPAEQNGGVAKLKALAGPYTNLQWMPTGGIRAENLADYLSFDKVVACGGTWIAKKELIKAENWGEIRHLAEQAVTAMLGFEVSHVGINTDNPQQAEETARILGAMFGFSMTQGNSSIFVDGKNVEIMKRPGLGKNGHIAISTNTLARAIPYFRNRGIAFREETISAKAAYFKDEIAGFAIHLVQK